MLSGINFGDATVIINANNVTIKDCTFTDTASFWAVNQGNAYSGATVENCTFTGSKSPTEPTVWISAKQAITIKDNTFLNSPAELDRDSARRHHRQLFLRRRIFDGRAWRRDLHSGYDRARQHHEQFH